MLSESTNFHIIKLWPTAAKAATVAAENSCDLL